jgi:hypothetical protein
VRRGTVRNVTGWSSAGRGVVTDWIILAVYVIGWLLVYRKAYVVLAEDMASIGLPLSTFDRAGSAALAMLVAVFWPVVVVGYGVWRVFTPVLPSERAAELDERERRIRELERDLGIKP